MADLVSTPSIAPIASLVEKVCSCFLCFLLLALLPFVFLLLVSCLSLACLSYSHPRPPPQTVAKLQALANVNLPVHAPTYNALLTRELGLLRQEAALRQAAALRLAAP